MFCTIFNFQTRSNEKDIFNVVKTDEVEALKEDVDYINSKINK